MNKKLTYLGLLASIILLIALTLTLGTILTDSAPNNSASEVLVPPENEPVAALQKATALPQEKATAVPEGKASASPTAFSEFNQPTVTASPTNSPTPETPMPPAPKSTLIVPTGHSPVLDNLHVARRSQLQVEGEVLDGFLDDYPTPLFSPDGTMMLFHRHVRKKPTGCEGWVCAYYLYELWRTDANGQSPVRLAEGVVGWAVWSPDSQQVAYLSRTAQGEVFLRVTRPDGTDDRLVANNIGHLRLMWLDTKTVIYQNSQKMVVALDLEGEATKTKQLNPPSLPISRAIDTFTISPQGSKGIFGEGSNLWLVHFDSQRIFPITPYVGAFVGVRRGIAWSPNGKTIAYASRNSIYFASEDGKVLTEVKTDWHPYSLAWSPNGELLAFAAHFDERSGYYDIYLLEPNTGQIKQLTNHPEDTIEFVDSLVWSPDGQKLIYGTQNSPEQKIQVIELSKTNPSNSPPSESSPPSSVITPTPSGLDSLTEFELSDCPYQEGNDGTIWIHRRHFTDNNYAENMPFETGTWVDDENIALNNYLAGVLEHELGGSSQIDLEDWQLETALTFSIAARTVGMYWCPARQFVVQDNEGNLHIGLYDNQPQWYNPGHSPARAEEYRNAVEDTQGIYVTYNDELVSYLTYRTTTGLYTVNQDPTGPHKGIYDPVALPDEESATGMGQLDANRWPWGVHHVQWKDYRQILVHYYTNVHLHHHEAGNITPAKRWNMLEHTIPSVLPRGETIPISVKIQNTSTLNWGSSHFVAYRWKRAASVEQWQTTAIPAGLAAGESSSQIDIQLNVPWVELAGGYILEWDVGELLPNNEIVWFSEQNLPETVEAWPTYRKSVAVVNPALNPYALDIYYVLDLSSSMGQLFEGAGNKLEAAKEAIMLANSFLNDATAQYPWMDNRVGLITFFGGQNGIGTPPTFTVSTNNLVAWRPWRDGLTDDFSLFNNKLSALFANGSTPTYHALGFAKGEMELDNAGGRQPVIVLLSDGVPTISSERFSFNDSDVEAVAVRNPDGSFRSIDEVRVDGGQGGAPGYFNGEPLADVMEEVQQGTESAPSRSRTDNLMIHTIAIQGMPGNTFQKDILDYVAAYGGGNSYADDEVLDLGQSILDALLQSAYGGGPLPTPTPAPTSTVGPSPTATKMPPPIIDCAVEWVIDYFGWGEQYLRILQEVRDKVLARDESGVGRRYIELFEKHSPEVVTLMAKEYELAKLGFAVVADTAKFALPLIEPMDDDDAPKFEEEYEELVTMFLKKLYHQASDELAQEVEIWLERIPLFHRMTALDIWKLLIELDG